jgi:hypothetical protein
MYAQQYYDSSARIQRLNDISTIHVNGRIFQKLDLISVLTINSSYTFNVYRRYNSDYNIVVEDCYGNLSFHQDESLHSTLKNRCALSDVELSSVYVSYFYSFKHNSVLNYIPCSIFTMKWSEIQDSYSAMDIALYYQPASSTSDEDVVQSDDSTKEDMNDPSVKSEESSDHDSAENSEVTDVSDKELAEEKSYEPVMYLASLFSCPACPPPFSSATSFANVIVNLQPVKVCNEDDCCLRICKKRSFCTMSDESESEDVEDKNEQEEEEEEEQEEEEEEEEDEEENNDESRYTILRNGTKFRKKN